LNAPTIEELVKKADQALEIFKTATVDDSSMEQMLAEFNYNNNKN
jgi:copper homeostasis protein CutC